ncbi:sigma-54-dependent Fis family transcriptional regulator [Neolewinella aurantiaca]|uniref:Sigma-54-dependent Fis family transcriptional regulator n=1 Tax=Neolewinella aurantiaca TaxID=2602767 RepID=A0A5C7FT94_9BACT|nr:sigma 54-interacting transcriptional regulator [Neolewinella aurantiaca]TXF88615.1 sigma-54-dependent Fis family transcriptional regulator [Neolewinella aurantiaca]
MANLDTIKRRYGIVGRSPALENALNTAIRVAPSDLSVLIMGESGVGKEVISRLIHDNSTRKHQGFIAINCGALPEGTINSELFGHVKGAYTSSTGDRKGYFETLDGGTIFLDEIGEMPPQTQTFLLRVLENGEFIRMGSNKVQKTDVRVVAATNRKLLDRVREGKFREDLYYRLSTVPIEMPSLRERTEDIYLLFRFFANNFAEKQSIEAIQLDEEARWLLEQYTWPGNIRELKNVAERMSILSEKRELSAVDLAELMPQLMQRNLPAIRREDQPGGSANSFQERDILYKVLFDMKEDMTQLKNLIADLIRSNNLSVRDVERVQSLAMPGNYPAAAAEIDRFAAADAGNVASEAYDLRDLDVVTPDVPRSGAYAGAGNGQRPHSKQPDYKSSDPIIVDHDMHRAYAESEIVDEDLSLANAEKELIKKALRKHNSRRKEAAAELGISERTLYRKIKEYEVSE